MTPELREAIDDLRTTYDILEHAPITLWAGSSSPNMGMYDGYCSNDADSLVVLPGRLLNRVLVELRDLFEARKNG